MTHVRSFVAFALGLGWAAVWPWWLGLAVALVLTLAAIAADRYAAARGRRGLARLVYRDALGERWETWSPQGEWIAVFVPGVVVDAIARRART